MQNQICSFLKLKGWKVKCIKFLNDDLIKYNLKWHSSEENPHESEI